jgi:hypothetical protein
MEQEPLGTIRGTAGEETIYLKHNHLLDLLRQEANT